MCLARPWLALAKYVLEGLFINSHTSQNAYLHFSSWKLDYLLPVVFFNINHCLCLFALVLKLIQYIL